MHSFVLLLDNSGSMFGEKLFALRFAAEGFLRGIKELALAKEPAVTLALLGGRAEAAAPVLAGQAALPEFAAGGEMRLAEGIAAAKPAAPGGFFVLFSDGGAVDGGFLDERPGLRTYAVAIGPDADARMLAQFAGCLSRVFPPHEAAMLPGYILGSESKNESN